MSGGRRPLLPVAGFGVLARAPLALLAAIGCGSPEPERGAEPAGGASTPVPAAARATPAPWYRKARALDLTGDGRVDSVRLDAVGTRPDSLRLALALIVDGTVRHREEWGSGYELALADSSRDGGLTPEARLRARLDTVLSSVRVQRLDEPGVRLMAEDRAILAGIEPRPSLRTSFAYGYETTVRLAWDAPRQRFVRLWSCC